MEDPETEGWERSDFPIVCSSCLGDNPYVRMIRETFGMQCKLCDRPFTTFRWKPGPKERYRKTEICQMCAKIKNTCQSCIMDLQFNIPVHVRDTLLQGQHAKDHMPENAANREFAQTQLEQKMKGGLQNLEFLDPSKNLDAMARFAKPGAYALKSDTQMCQMYVRGECRRGDSCPYRHERPRAQGGGGGGRARGGPGSSSGMPVSSDGLDGLTQEEKEAVQSIRSVVGNDSRSRGAMANPGSTDRSISTLYVGGLVDDTISNEDLKDYFTPFGELKSVRVVHRTACAFVTFRSRGDAEKALENFKDGLVVQGKKLKVLWAFPSKRGDKAGQGGASMIGSGMLTGQGGPSTEAEPTLDVSSLAHMPALPGMGKQGFYPAMLGK